MSYVDEASSCKTSQDSNLSLSLPTWGGCIWCQFCQSSPMRFGRSFCLQEHRYTRCRVLCMGRRVFGCWAVCLVHRLQNGFVPLGTSGPMVVSCSCAGFLVIQEGACWDSTGNQQNQVLLPSGSSSQQGPPQTHAPTPYLRQYKMEQVSWADRHLARATRHMVLRVAAWPVSV